MDFVFVKLIFTLRLELNISDPYALFRIKTDFISAFREAVCGRMNGCEECTGRGACSYHATFSQAVSEDTTAVKRHQKPSLPFVFDFPLLPGPPNSGNEIEIGLVLAGTAINYVNDYIAAMCLTFNPVSAGRRGIAKVVRVESVTISDCRNVIMENGAMTAPDNVSTISVRDIADMKDLDPNRIRLTITTPMRLLHDGKPVRGLTFPLFIRPLLRRISSLAYYYYGDGLEVDYKWLSSLSESVKILENGFHPAAWGEENYGERFAGISGSGVFEGMLTDFHNFLLLGEYFHVGKGASYGLGRYRIDRG